MHQLNREIANFTACRREERRWATQSAAFFIMTGIDLAAALVTRGEDRRRIACRLERLLERERLKGARSHWSYDLNRHIALKQALDRLNGRHGAETARPRQRRRAAAPR